MRDLDKQLYNAKMAVLRRKQLLARMDSLIGQRDELQQKEQQLAEQLNKEQADVEKLEGTSLRKYICYIAGSYDEKLDQEKQEAYEASVRYEAARKELDAVTADVEKTAAELDTLIDCDTLYAKLLQEKTERIQAMDAAQGNAIMQLEELLHNLDGQHRELKEAVAAGEQALTAAQDAMTELNKAADWGFWDMLGGGVLVDMAKHSHLDAAQRCVEDLQLELRSFRTELADVAVDGNVQIRMDGFLYFADYFFDGLFADWAALDHIEKSQNQVNDVIQQIRSVLQSLESMLQENEQTRTELQQKRDRLIIEY